MRVLVLKDGTFLPKEIKTNLEALQKEVGGYIEIPYLIPKLHEEKIDIVINEDGKSIKGMKPTLTITKIDGTILDVIYGPCIFTSHDGKGNTIGLNEYQCNVVKEVLKKEAFLTIRNTGSYIVRVAIV